MEALPGETRQSLMNRSARTNGFGSLVPYGLAAAFALLLSAPLAVHTHTVSAQETAHISVDQVVISEEGDEVTAFVSLLDAAGQPILGQTDFDVFVDDSRVRLGSVQSVVDEETGIAVLLLLDISGSMAGEPLEQAKSAATSFVEQLLAPDIAAVATFAGVAPDGAAFVSDGNALVETIAALSAEQETGTALYDAVVNGLAIASEAPTARRAVVLLTDGRDSGAVSQQTRISALQAAASSGLPVYTIGLGMDADGGFLRSLAQDSGGAFYEAPTAADVPAIFDTIATTLRSQYAVTAELPHAQTEEREVVVTVDLDGSLLTAHASFLDPNAVVQADSGGGGVPTLVLAAATLGAVVLVASGFILVRRRAHRRSPTAGGPGQDVSMPAKPATAIQAETIQPGKLTVVAGPNVGASVAVTSAPVDIGSDPTCGLELDADDGTVASRHARVWLHNGRLMLHHLARGRATLVEGRPMEWAALGPSDALQIGPHTIAFALDG
jgi:Mg-chelatase subunit ChlD